MLGIGFKIPKPIPMIFSANEKLVPAARDAWVPENVRVFTQRPFVIFTV
jgi:hypothetical protein